MDIFALHSGVREKVTRKSPSYSDPPSNPFHPTHPPLHPSLKRTETSWIEALTKNFVIKSVRFLHSHIKMAIHDQMDFVHGCYTTIANSMRYKLGGSRKKDCHSVTIWIEWIGESTFVPVEGGRGDSKGIDRILSRLLLQSDSSSLHAHWLKQIVILQVLLCSAWTSNFWKAQNNQIPYSIFYNPSTYLSFQKNSKTCRKIQKRTPHPGYLK